MARMTLTNTPRRPDSGAVAVVPPDSDSSVILTPAHPDSDSGGYPDPGSQSYPDSDHDPARTRTPDSTRTRTRTLSPGPGGQTWTPDSDSRTTVIDLEGPGPDDDTQTRTRTRTQTRADHAREIHLRRELTKAIDYPGRWWTRHRAAAEARRRAIRIAIDRGIDAELMLREAEAAGELAAADEPPARWERFAAGWPQWLLTIAVSIMASVGQIQFAKENGAVGIINVFGWDVTPLGGPAVFDLSVAGLYAFGMYVAVRHKASPWLPWAAGTVIGAFSVYTNTQHEGALFFASASAVLLVTWLVRMVIKWQHLPHVKARRSTAKPRLLTSSLVFASRATAMRAWTISRRRPIATCAARLSKKNNEEISERDLVIRAAELFNTVYADRATAEVTELREPPTKEMGKAAQHAWKRDRELALKRAEIVAWDAVDALLGLPVIERQGIRVNQVTYREPEPEPEPEPRRRKQLAPDPAGDRRVPGSKPPRQPVPEAARPDDEVIVIRPGGNKGRNWVPLAAIPHMPKIDEAIRCECGPDAAGRCGESLRDHVQRRGEQIRDFVLAVPGWAERPDRISKPDVAPLGLGSGATMDVVWLMNQLRSVARAGNGDVAS